MERDIKFLRLAREVSSWAKCSSRKIGAVLVRDNHIISTGYNGAPVGSSMCQDPNELCLRKAKGYKSGEGLVECPAVHAEVNAIIQAAYEGHPTKGCTIYCYCCHPCKDCTAAIINAGISRIVCLEGYYDELSLKLSSEASQQGRLIVNQYQID